jgi:hypothetical protein
MVQFHCCFIHYCFAKCNGKVVLKPGPQHDKNIQVCLAHRRLQVFSRSSTDVYVRVKLIVSFYQLHLLPNLILFYT